MARPKVSWPIIRPRKNQAGSVTSWMVDCGMMKGKRVRFFYKTRGEAEGQADVMRIKRQNEGNGAFGLVNRDRADAETAIEMLAPHSVTLRQAARFYIDNHDVVQAKKTYNEVLAELLHAKDRDGRSVRYQKDMKGRLQAAGTAFGERILHEIRGNEIDDYLRGLEVGGVSRNNVRRLFSVLFSFAVRRRYALSNPIKQVEIVTIERRKPAILTLPECRALMAAANPELVPAVAIALFGGLRPEAELIARDHPLGWKHIDFQEMTIDVEQSKNTGSHRFVTIQENLAQWLRPHAKKSGAICEADYYGRLRKARAVAIQTLAAAGEPSENLVNWPGDILRHTYGSYHCAAFKDCRATSQEMGHSGDLQVFNRHYRNRVKEAEALRFWQIQPGR